MRKTLLASAALFGLALALPAHAQDQPSQPATTGMSGKPMSGTDMRPEDFLQSAQHDVKLHRAAAAQDALEHAETRLLDRSTDPSRADQPDTAPAVQEISQAIAAIGKHDWKGAGQHIDSALQQAQMAQSSGGGMTAPPGSMTSPATTPISSGTPAGGMPAAPPPATMGTSPAPGGMTTGQPALPMGGVSQPNGGVMAPAGGVMPPSVQ
jgi:hypothetical protein